MSVVLLVRRLVHRFAFGGLGHNYEVEHQVIVIGTVNQGRVGRQVHGIFYVFFAGQLAGFDFVPARHQRERGEIEGRLQRRGDIVVAVVFGIDGGVGDEKSAAGAHLHVLTLDLDHQFAPSRLGVGAVEIVAHHVVFGGITDCILKAFYQIVGVVVGAAS